jgi:hypothetical protein
MAMMVHIVGLPTLPLTIMIKTMPTFEPYRQLLIDAFPPVYCDTVQLLGCGHHRRCETVQASSSTQRRFVEQFSAIAFGTVGTFLHGLCAIGFKHDPLHTSALKVGTFVLQNGRGG